MDGALLTLKQLDQQTEKVKEQGGYLSRPKSGWVRTFRKALGMTTLQLAQRIGVARSRVTKIETDELEDVVTLKTLRKAAEAMDCTLVYSFVPKKGLEETVKARAKEKAQLQIQRTAHTMDLEAQSVKNAWLDQQTQEITASLLRQSWKHLWED